MGTLGEAEQSASFLVQKKDYSHKVADNRQVDKQVPHEVVISKTLLGVENSSQGVEDATSANQRKKWGRGTIPKEREEDNNQPTHDQINSKANRRNGAFR